jgi:dTMP kinase
VTARFIVFEGPDGSGKSTQARRLAGRLDALLTREPGGTPVGEQLRSVVLDPTNELDPRCEALTIAAGRAQHVAFVVAPTLAGGRHVISDRFWASSIAYQGAARGLGEDVITELNRWAINGCVPDLTVFIDIDPEHAHGRIDRPLDRLELVDEAFRTAVRTSFHRQAAADPEHWVIVDGRGDAESVGQRVDAALRDRLAL